MNLEQVCVDLDLTSAVMAVFLHAITRVNVILVG